MADKCVESILPEIGRELCLVKGEKCGYRGYMKDILIENLSERENAMFVCIRCQGIMREVCISSGGEQFCSSCKEGSEQIHPNLQMDNMVLSFKCSCPLATRGCKWLGALGGCQDHLDTCGYVLEACKLRCGVVLQRDELKVHEKEKCPQRIMKCKHCRNNFITCELPTHFELCPRMKVSCELECGDVMCREDMTQHVEQECVEKEIECPFAKYKCVGLIKRKDLNKHLAYNRIDHLEMKLNILEDIVSKQSETIEKLTAMQQMDVKKQSTVMKTKMETLEKDGTGVMRDDFPFYIELSEEVNRVAIPKKRKAKLRDRKIP